MAIGISPTVDFAFKLMLGSPEHSRVTIHFLNAILVGQPRIMDVQILNPFLSKEDEDDKLSILDVLATDEHGRMLNIEMQTSLPSELPQRLVYYASCLYVGQLTEGEKYSVLRPAISICVLTQTLFPQISGLHLDFRLREESGVMLTDNLQIHFLELSKLKVTAHNVYHATPAERWAFFLRNAEQLTPTDIGQLFPDKEIAEAAGVLEMISQTPAQRLLYDARLKFQRDEESKLRHARQEGEARGVRIGRIRTLQDLLGMRQSTTDELAECDEAQLHEKAEQLQDQLRSRNQSGHG